MEFEFWWLLAFPLFFGLGWLAARIDISHLLTESRNVPDSYFKGLNFLLNEQPDKAVEAFVEVVKLDTETVDLHFALGGLFRRRGEVERAIRLHQNLVERDSLSQEKKIAALNELAQDYLKAGLLDRAEQIFNQLLPTHFSKTALKFLLEIYVQEKEWQKAVDTARQLENNAEQSYAAEIAHFYCELALQASAHANKEAAREYLQEAVTVNRKSARATILLGDLEATQHHCEPAIQIWKRIETQNPDYLSLIAERMLGSYRELGRVEEGLQVLRGFLSRYPALDLLSVVFQATLESQGTEAAYRLVRDELRKTPSLHGLDKLLDAQLLDASPERQPDLQLMKNLVHQHAQRLAMYQCATCGFRARRFYWQCPTCAGWDTYAPRRKEE